MNLIEGTHRKSPVSERAVLVKTDGRSDAVPASKRVTVSPESLNRTWHLLFGSAHFRSPFGNGLKNWRRGNCRTCAF